MLAASFAVCAALRPALQGVDGSYGPFTGARPTSTPSLRADPDIACISDFETALDMKNFTHRERSLIDAVLSRRQALCIINQAMSLPS